MFKLFLHVAFFFLPWALRRRALNRVFGFKIAPSARVGFSILYVDGCVMGAGARVGHLSIVKGLRLLEVGECGILGNLNWVTGFPISGRAHFGAEAERDPCLLIERHAAITNRHMVDCTDRVTIGEFATVGGFRSQILSHSIDLKSNRQSCRPITVGAYCFIGTGAILLKGSVLPERSVLGAGSVLTNAMTEPGMLYSGVPAKPIRPVDTTGEYFSRNTGFVH